MCTNEGCVPVLTAVCVKPMDAGTLRKLPAHPSCADGTNINRINDRDVSRYVPQVTPVLLAKHELINFSTAENTKNPPTRWITSHKTVRPEKNDSSLLEGHSLCTMYPFGLAICYDNGCPEGGTLGMDGAILISEWQTSVTLSWGVLGLGDWRDSPQAQRIAGGTTRLRYGGKWWEGRKGWNRELAA